MDKKFKDNLGNRMKAYESQETDRKFIPTLPVYARIDGRSFSKFTKGMQRPFDPRMTDAMIEVTKYLVKETHAVIGYVQSDEISLLWHQPNTESEIFFDGRVHKMTSVLASMASAKLSQVIRGWEPFEDRLPAFDARVISLPNKTEATNMFLWRSLDATKNAVSMACRHYYSAKQMQNKNQQQMKDMMKERGVDFDADFPDSFKYGTFVKKVVVERLLTVKEWLAIPENYRPDPDVGVIRSEMQTYNIQFKTIIDRDKFIFNPSYL